MAEIITSGRATSVGGPGLSYLLGAKFLGVPLAMSRMQAQKLRAAIEARAFDSDVSAGVFASKFAGSYDQRSRFRVTDDGVAVVAIQGVLIDRGAFLGDFYGMMTSYEGLAEQFQRLAKDSAIKSVVLDIDSPGGMVAGLYDLTAELEKLTKVKKVCALAANMADSAAYAIACVADEVYVTRTGEAGSIGVVMLHQSYARALDAMGVDTTIIAAGEHKADGNPFQALSHGARSEMAAGIDEAYQQFVAHVAKHRGLDEAAVIATQARTYSGSQAVAAGLADGVKSFEELLESIRKGSSKAAPKRAVKGVRGSAIKGGGPVSARTHEPDEGLDYDAVITAAMASLAASQAAAAKPTVKQPDALAIDVAVTSAAPASAAPAAAAAPAAQDARARIKSILGSAHAKDRPGLAQHIALETDVDLATAEAILKTAAVEKPDVKAGSQTTKIYDAIAASGGNPRVAAAGGDGSQASRPEINVERQKARFAKAGR